MKKENELSEKKDFKPILIYILVTFGLSFVIGIIYGIVQGIRGGELDIDFANYLGSTIPMAIVLIVFLIMYRKRLKNDIKRLKAKDILMIVLISIGTVVINALVSMLLEHFNLTSGNQNTLADMFVKHKIITSLLMVVMAPVVEEFVFRYSISSLIKKDIVFLIVSSILFGLAHTIGIATILYVFLGAIFGLVYLKYKKNVAASIIIHMINNLFAVITMFLGL